MATFGNMHTAATAAEGGATARDVLDQLTDAPAPGERVHVYKLQGAAAALREEQRLVRQQAALQQQEDTNDAGPA